VPGTHPVPKALVAGAVMALNLKGGQKDDKGTAINTEWMPVDTKSPPGRRRHHVWTLGNTANPNKTPTPTT
jgi:hypothetical protein